MTREKTINYLKIHDMRNPRCCTAEQYRGWRLFKPDVGCAGFCEDCTPEYQKNQSNRGTCDHPEVLFYEDDDGLIYGSFLIKDDKAAIVAK